MSPEELGFFAAMCAEPEDPTPYLVFADWLQDRDDHRADGYRTMGEFRRRPYRTDFTNGPYDHGMAHWYECESQRRAFGHKLIVLPATDLPRLWCKKLTGIRIESMRSNCHVYYISFPGALNDAAEAWALLTEEEREQCRDVLRNYPK